MMIMNSSLLYQMQQPTHLKGHRTNHHTTISNYYYYYYHHFLTLGRYVPEGVYYYYY